MSNYHDQMLDYQHQAESNFDAYHGFEGNEDAYYPAAGYYPNPYEQLHDGYNMASVGQIDPNDRTLTVVVKNTGLRENEAVIFGGNESLAQPGGVTVEVQESSHQEVREDSKANPFRIVGMKMSVNDALQFDRILRIIRRTPTGMKSERIYQPRNATSPQNTLTNLIDDDNFAMDVSGQDSLRLKVLPQAHIVFTFTIRARANMGNVLDGRNVAEMSQAPRTTGLPQIDLLRRSQPPVFGMPPRRPLPPQRPLPPAPGNSTNPKNHLKRR